MNCRRVLSVFLYISSDDRDSGSWAWIPCLRPYLTHLLWKVNNRRASTICNSSASVVVVLNRARPTPCATLAYTPRRMRGKYTNGE